MARKVLLSLVFLASSVVLFGSPSGAGIKACGTSHSHPIDVGPATVTYHTIVRKTHVGGTTIKERWNFTDNNGRSHYYGTTYCR